MPDTVVETHNLTHRYGDRVALQDLTFGVGAGEAFAMLGPNGSGKTTLFRILSTLVRPREGRASILGLDLATRSADVRRNIGVVFQSPALDKQLTAEENLRYHGHLYGLRGTDLTARVRDLLNRVNLADRAADRVGTFSGGMRRRVELAKGLLHRPRVLLLDEPSTGLDPAARQDVWAYLNDVRRQDGVTVLLTTHLMDEADRCDRVAILNAGRLVACDAPAVLKDRIGGDVITLTVTDPTAASAVIRGQFGITPEALDGSPHLRIERPRGHEFIPALIESLPGLVTAVTVGKPTLEDVFRNATGRAFEGG